MSCENKIFQNIESTCQNKVVAGVEQKIYLLNRTDIETINYDESISNKVTGITLKTGKHAYLAQGLKKNMSAGWDRVITEDGIDTFSNTLSITAFEFDSNANKNLNEMGDIVAVVVRKGTKLNDGSVMILGLGNGMYCSSDNWSAFENGGTRKLEFASLADAGEEVAYYNYCVQAGTPATDSYTATIAELEAMLPTE